MGMVPACTEFNAGDAVQIADGIVHAGPRCEWRSGLPRIVVFSTYTTLPIPKYNPEYQYKVWDWASFKEVPAVVAYRRLLEVHLFASMNKLSVEPWTFYRGERFE